MGSKKVEYQCLNRVINEIKFLTYDSALPPKKVTKALDFSFHPRNVSVKMATEMEKKWHSRKKKPPGSKPGGTKRSIRNSMLCRISIAFHYASMSP